MDDFASSVLSSLSSQPVKAFLGLKKYQWSRRAQYQTVARGCLESMGVNNLLAVNCFLKTGRSYVPALDPNVVNIFLRLHGRNNVRIIL